MNANIILGLLATITLLSSSPPHAYAKNHQMMNGLRSGSSISSPTDNNKNNPIIDNTDVLLPEFFPPDMKKEDVEFYLKKTKTLSPISITNVSKNDWLHQCAATFNKYYNLKTDQVLRSEFYFINETSGLCADALSCAFDKCYGSVKGGNSTDSIDCLNNQTDLASTTYDDVASMCNFPPSSLPEYITFPKNAAHVIAAIRYAKQNNVQISIKSTGHSYTGAHTKAGSLMLNMRDYTKYASGNDKIIECNGSGVQDDILGDACILAKARGKDAYIRVGGGQTWSDVHIAVNASNGVGNLSKMYDLGGGGSGSVGAAGGWLSGGGLSTGYERIHGLGIDQILELEVALPDGSHVRVFPIEWNNSEEYINPQTTKVAALCNTNVVANEDKWDWQPCTDLTVSPEDIWLAQRGGGGGTFAVTLSVKYQLFQQYPFQAIFMGLGALAASSDEKSKDLSKQISEKFKENKLWVWEEARRTYALFLVDLLFAPEKIGVSEEASFSCGQAGMNYQFIGYGVLYCISAESVFPEIIAAWERTIKGTQLAKEDTGLAHLLSKVVISGESIGFGPYSSYADFIGDFLRKVEYPGTYNDIFPDDVIPDAPLPARIPDEEHMSPIGQFCSINLPLALLQSDNEAERSMLFKILDVVGDEAGHVTGGNVEKLGDGMNSVAPTVRSSGHASLSFKKAIEKYGNSILIEYLTAVYKYADTDHFPGFYEYNHFCSDASSVTKANWTKSCDSEGDDECFSLQELVWGEDLYVKLQNIKAAIDPDNLLDCYPCVKPSIS